MAQYPDSPPLNERFEAQAKKSPDAIAVSFEEQTLTYRELNARANQVARKLQRLGVVPDSLVALSAERSIELVVGILAIAKAGGAYVPLDPAYPQDRLEFMLFDSGARVLLTHRGARAAPSAEGVPTVLIDDAGDESTEDVKSGLLPHHLAYVIYTSGSTGRPKGVLVTQANVVRLFTATEHWYGFGPSDVWTLFHSYAFDFSVWELWGALLYGGRVVVVPYYVSRSPDAFYELLGREGVTVLNQTPSAFRQLIHAALASTAKPPDALRYVVFGGEALELQGLRPWFDKFGDEKPSLINMYGITETTVHVTYRPITWREVRAGLGSVIGVPIPDLGTYLLDEQLKPVPDGEQGEIFVEGAGLARGYLNRPELNEQRFPTLALAGGKPTRVYRTGDLARRLPGGELEYLGRIDHQVKIRGFRIELGEIESVIAEHPAVKDCVVIAREDTPGDKRLVGYVATDGTPALVEELRAKLKDRVPEYMVPAAFVLMPKLPLTENGKVDRKALPAPDTSRPALETEYAEPEGELETEIAAIWKRLLRIREVGANDGFFELGGSSLLAVESLVELRQKIGKTVPVVTLFQYPTVRGLARALAGAGQAAAAPADELRERAERQRSGRRDAIAIVGMACRYPGASSVAELWANVCAGKETVKFFAKEELDPRVDTSDPAYVAARGVLEDADKFDAAFFGEPPALAELMDPQQRVLLELSVAALEDAGVVPERHGGSIGVFAGSGHNTYLLKNVVYRLDKLAAVGDLAVILGNDKDFVATRIAHKLNLTGPAVSVHTACSTSLVAVCQAYRSLLDYECDVALAGAASVTVPQQAGHVYAEGAMLSSDGHTRTFDAAASGTVFSDGAGMVVLKRLSDAQRDGDRIYAVIRGAAINNDGAAKASYTAPSVAGQAGAIAMAHAVSGVDPETITYVEAHGTATPLGDPVEIEALTQAFRARTERRGFCAIGSVKSNIGHATAASGVAGLIKTALCASTGKLAPSLFFDRPNPNIDFSATPFFVQTKLADWTPPSGVPRRAGVSSFGVGGTNAHVVVEEPPLPVPTGAARGTELLVVSAKTEAALARRSGEIANFLETESAPDLADVAYTLAARRTHYAHRRFVVGKTRAEVIAGLRAAPDVTTQRKVERRGGPVAFMFPGQGAQYVGMGRAIYETEPVFKQAVDRCAEILRPLLGRDLREVVFPDPTDAESAEAALRQTMFTQPTLFTIEYALASLWQSWGIEPSALVGHSVGEFVGACLAGVFSLESAVSLVGQRGTLMQGMPPGSMLSVRAAADAVERRLPPGIALAASNGPALCVVAGPKEPIDRFRDELEKEGIVAKLLFTSHAFHSEMMEPVVLPFAEEVRRAKPAAPRIPIISTATGALLTPEQATDPMYWARHLRQPVRFTEALRTLWSDPSLALLEVGPRTTCATLARQIVTDRGRQIAMSSLDDRTEAEWPSLLRAAGQLWLGGASIDWEAIQAIGRRRLVSLPAYPFARDRHWLEPAEALAPPLRAKAGEGMAAPPVPIAGTLEDPPAMGMDASADVLVGVVSAQLQLMQAQLEALQRAEAGEVNTAAEE